jgi:hypothetical protein
LTITNALLIFSGGFASVFTLGFQSRAVNGGNYLLAACCSFTIAFFQAHLWRLIALGDGSLSASAIYGLSGSCAITLAMWAHHRMMLRKARTQTETKSSPSG